MNANNYEGERFMFPPIVVFVYNRVDRIEKLIDSLAKNLEASESDIYIYIFSDGQKSMRKLKKVQAVRDYIDTIPERGLFRAVHITKVRSNKRLTISII